VICHCLLNRVFRLFHPEYVPVVRPVGQDVGDTWEWNFNAFEIALDSSLTHASIATSFVRSGLDGSPASRQAWNLGQSVLSSERSGGLRKDGRHCVSIHIRDPISVRSTWSDTLGRTGFS
jgi:hypothetical protein